MKKKLLLTILGSGLLVFLVKTDCFSFSLWTSSYSAFGGFSSVTSGIWSSTNTWSPGYWGWWNDWGGRLPNQTDWVVVTDGYTLYIDTPAVCGDITLWRNSRLVFLPGSGVRSLTVSSSFNMEYNSEFIIDPQNANETFSVYIGGNVNMLQESARVNIDTHGNNSTVNFVSDALITAMISAPSDNQFNITASTRSTVNANIRMIWLVSPTSAINIKVSSACATVNLTSTGDGSVYGKMLMLPDTEFSTEITADSSTVNITFDDIDVNYPEMKPVSRTNATFNLINSTYTSNLTLNLGGYLLSKGITFNCLGAEPWNSTAKPDPYTVRRNIKLLGVIGTSSGIILPDRTWSNIRNAEIAYMGNDIEGKFGAITVNELNGSDIQNRFSMYNCYLHDNYSGVYIYKCDRLNREWRDQGISSSVFHNNGVAGAWFSTTSRSELYNCTIAYTSYTACANLGYVNYGDGIYIVYSPMCSIKNCNIYGSTKRGIFLRESDFCLIDNNSFHDQDPLRGEEGIYVYNARKNVIINNRCYNNPVHGIALEYDSRNNYVSGNQCYNNSNGGMRVRYGSHSNTFLINYSSNNARTGFSSHSSTCNLIADDYYANNTWGDIYIEGESNKGYPSQIWLKDCLLNSATEFANTAEKQEFTHPESWVYSQKHKGTSGLTRIWGNFDMPQPWHTSILKWNYADQTYDGWAAGWDKALIDNDTPGLRYDDQGGHSITSITTSSTTKTEVWLVTYLAGINRWQVRGSYSGIQRAYLIPDTDYVSDNGEVRLRITNQSLGPSPCEEYVFVTVAPSKDSDTQKTIQFSDFSDPGYIGASYMNRGGATFEIIGSSVYPTIITRKLAEDFTTHTSFYYHVYFHGGTINKIENAAFDYLDSNGLIFYMTPQNNTKNITLRNLQPGTNASYITAKGITHTFDNVAIETSTVKGTYNVTAFSNAILTFRDYIRPSLPDSVTTVDSQVYWDPTLEFSGLSNFEATGAQPNFADAYVSREFQIKYFDKGLAEGGSPPTTIQVWVDLNDNGAYGSNEKFDLSLKPTEVNNGNYADGEVYYMINSTIGYVGDGIINYRFYASNPYSVTVSTVDGTWSNEATYSPNLSSSVTVRGVPPRITINMPEGTQTGQVSIYYQLIDDDNKPYPRNLCYLSVEYSIDGSSWIPAARGSASEGLNRLISTLSPGTTHLFVWDTLVDLDNQDTYVKIRIFAHDEDGEAVPTLSQSFAVDNIRATNLAATFSPQDIPYGATTQILTVEARNSAGIKDIDAVSVLNLQSSSTNYVFLEYASNVIITSVTMQMGEAKFRYRDEIIGRPTVTFSETPSAGLVDVIQTWSINSGGVNPNRSTLQVQGSLTPLVGSTVTVIVTLKDSFGNTVSNKNVALGVSGTGNYITQPTFASNDNGEVFASFFSHRSEQKVITATDISDSVALVSSASIVFAADAVNEGFSNFTIMPNTSTVFAGTTITIYATLYDKHLNIVPNKDVRIGVSPLDSVLDVVTQPGGLSFSTGPVRGTLYGGTTGYKTIIVTDITDNIVLTSSYTVFFAGSIYYYDRSAPTIVSVSPENQTVVTTPVNKVSATLVDSGGSGINLTSSTIRLFLPNGTEVVGTQNTLGSDTIVLNFTSVSSKGIYTMEVTPMDNANNAPSTPYRYTFTMNVSASAAEAVLKETTHSYPNPVTNGKARFSYQLIDSARVTIKVYDVLGNLVWEDEQQGVTGDNSYEWNCINKSTTKIASGVYVYKVAVNDGQNKYEVRKKVIVVQ